MMARTRLRCVSHYALARAFRRRCFFLSLASFTWPRLLLGCAGLVSGGGAFARPAWFGYGGQKKASGMDIPIYLPRLSGAAFLASKHWLAMAVARATGIVLAIDPVCLALLCRDNATLWLGE